MMSCLILVLQFSLAQGRCYCSAPGTGFLVPPLSSPVGCLVAILVVSVAPQGFACPHHPAEMQLAWQSPKTLLNLHCESR